MSRDENACVSKLQLNSLIDVSLNELSMEAHSHNTTRESMPSQ